MHNRRLRPAVTLLATAALAIGGQSLLAPSSPAAPKPRIPRSDTPAPGNGLDAKDRARLAAAERAGRKSVTVLIAAKDGQDKTAAAKVRALGGRITGGDARIGYVKASVPISKADNAAKLRSVEAIDVDGLIKLDDPAPAGSSNPAAVPPPNASTPRSNPYLPTRDTDAESFARRSPNQDGRGTRVAVLDSGVDLAHPSLNTTSTGERKIVDWYNANSPDSGDGTWVRQSTQTYTGTFTSDGRTWTAPSSGGPYTFGLFRETAGDLGAPDSELGGDVNRDGDRTDSFGVLLDPSTSKVRVDVDQNGDFTDNSAMTDYATNYDVGRFGTDNPATPIAESVSFVVQTDHPGYVNIGIAGAEHGSHVAGIAAGNKLFGGKMDGAAPGAKLVAVKVCLTSASCTSSGLIDGVVYAAKHNADVVNISIGGLPALNDGNNARAELYNRTIAEYNVQLFISAGNSGAGANSVGDPSVATDAISVGSYITRETWMSNYGSRTVQPASLHSFSSRGPREDGGFKPDIVAPGAAISTVPQWEQPGPVAGTYSLPPGYAMLQGTSMAAPEATGAAALLVGAWKASHNGERPNVVALRNAIKSSARYISGIGAYEQGAGLINVPAAYAALTANPDPDSVTTSVEVHTTLSYLLPKPNVGVGIHDREGVTRGQAYTRTYTLTRTSGASGPAKYRVDWVGNDRTFASAKTVTLPLNQPVSFPVRVDPRKSGVHSALLRLDNPKTSGIDVQTMNTVFVPLTFSTANGYTVRQSGTVYRNQSVRRFVRVPSGATALRIDMTAGGAAGEGQVRFLRYSPDGTPLDNTATTSCYNPDAGAGCAGGTALSRTVINPQPGVWEIVVEARRTSDATNPTWKIVTSVLGASVSPNPDVIASGTVGTPINRSYTVTNALGAFTGRLRGSTLSSAKVARPTIAQGAQQQYQINVQPGSTSLTARIGNTSDVSADLDLLVYNCTSGTCVLAGQSADGDSEEAVTIPNPAAGRYVVLVDGYAVPAGTTEYDYIDAYSSPSLGSIAVADANALRPSGSTWTVSATVTPQGSPGDGRVLRGQLAVVTSDEIPVGTGVVQISSLG